MASLIPGFEYDIFVSYRQKDNKHDGWVTEFVDNLKGELESTFKEDISVYFDINPHNGLLETYDVDASLKDKLKCLLFIPIISRTYCDPKSFAWEHEFKAFVELAKQDPFGLKVKLPNGNVASRVLPVRIYDLDTTDIKLCESIVGGVLRGVDFIYRSSGVNRPLRSKEEKPQENLNNTLYRDQINKVSNSVKEIIYCLNPESKNNTYHQEPIIEPKNYKESIPESSVIFEDEKSKRSIIGKFCFSKKLIISLGSMVFILGILGLWGWLRSYSKIDPKLSTYSTLPVESILMDPNGLYPFFSLSPDGRTIAYSSDKGILIRDLSSFSTNVLKGTEKSTLVTFSPDGKSLAFEKDRRIYKIGINGATISLICTQGAGTGMFWGVDGYIYFSPGFGHDGIWRISSNGGVSEQMTTVIDSLEENAHRWAQLLPDSKTLLYTVLGPSTGSTDSRIMIQQLFSNERKILVENATYGRYLSNENLLFANNEGNIFTLSFDLNKLKTRGEPTAVLDGVYTAAAGGAVFISVSETGNLVFLPRNTKPLNILSVVDRSGKLIGKDSIPISVLERIGNAWSYIGLSPSGSQIAITGRSFGSTDINILNLENWETERITFDISEDECPVWSPDGKAIAYTSALTANNRRLFIKDLNSAGTPKLIRSWPRHIHLSSWSQDGKWLAGHDYTATNGTDCYSISVDSGDTIIIASSNAYESDAKFSPDLQWIAFQSDESGRFEIYVVSFPSMKNKRQISTEGGRLPYWDQSGKFIYYLCNDILIAHLVETDNDFIIGKPNKLFSTNAVNFNVSPDGQKFYLVRQNDKRPKPPLMLITNWFQELDTKTN